MPVYSPVYLEASQLTCDFGSRRLFDIDHLTVSRGDRIGITGPNGCGKSTLAAFLAGQPSPVVGQVRRLAPISYVPQFAPVDRPLSGGEAARLRLKEAVFSPDTLLILDEPTAHLDLQGQQALLDQLEDAGAFVIISHDRAFLTDHCHKIWYLENGRLTVYAGNYQAFADHKARQLESDRQQYRHYLQEKARLTQAAQQLQQQSASVRKAPSRMGNSEARLHKRGKGTAAKARYDQARKAIETRLEQLPQVERPYEAPPIKLDFSLTHPPRARYVLQAEGFTFGYDKPLVKDAAFRLPNGSKTALVGSNGCGKTTLMNLILSGHPGLTLSPQARPGLLCQDLSSLQPDQTVLENAVKGAVQDQTTVRTVLSRLLFSRESLRQPVTTLSGGEKLKLCLCQLICGPANMLLLDEPTNYLDLPSRQAMEEVIAAYPGTVLMVCHDAAFLNACAQRLLILENQRLISFEGSLAAWEAQRRPSSAKDPMAITRLEMRLSELIARLSAASPQEKEALEAAYADCLAQLQTLRRQA